MNETQLSSEVQKLLKQVKEVAQKPVQLSFKEEKKGWLASDQAQFYLHDGHLQLDVYDVSATDYTVSHELLHMLSMSEQTPQINFHMTTGDDERDAKIMAAGTELYDTVLHLQIYPQQAELGLIDENVSEMYFQGVLAQLQPEQPDQVDEWMVLRTVKLLDALIFFAGKQDQIKPKLQELYPQCLAAAEKLAQGLLEKPVSGPQKLRAAIVKLWRGFDEQLSAWGQNPLGLNDFISLEPVLSERQTRLFVSQLFEVYHSSLQDNLHFKPAYIVRYKSDRQNSFILPEPAGDKEKFFRSFYAAKINEILPQIHVDYLLR